MLHSDEDFKEADFAKVRNVFSSFKYLVKCFIFKIYYTAVYHRDWEALKAVYIFPSRPAFSSVMFCGKNSFKLFYFIYLFIEVTEKVKSTSKFWQN